MTGWLSTCSVALPPLRVNRTTWYLPSLTITALSSMVMSSVPTLKITPIFPRSYRQRTIENILRKIQLDTKKCTFNTTALGETFWKFWEETTTELSYVFPFCSCYQVKLLFSPYLTAHWITVHITHCLMSNILVYD